jgi:hypothetical protein
MRAACSWKTHRALCGGELTNPPSRLTRRNRKRDCVRTRPRTCLYLPQYHLSGLGLRGKEVDFSSASNLSHPVRSLRRNEADALAAIADVSHRAQAAALSTRVRDRKRLTSIGTPTLLTAGFQPRPNTSMARTSAGAKMRLLDSNSARRRALKFLFFLGWFAGARVSLPKDAFLTRPWPISRLRQRSEQNRCCRARRGTERLQPAQITGASRLLANAFVIANSSFQNRGNKLVVADIGKRAIDHEFLRQRAGNQTGKLNGVARAHVRNILTTAAPCCSHSR